MITNQGAMSRLAQLAERERARSGKSISRLGCGRKLRRRGESSGKKTWAKLKHAQELNARRSLQFVISSFSAAAPVCLCNHKGAKLRQKEKSREALSLFHLASCEWNYATEDKWFSKQWTARGRVPARVNFWEWKKRTVIASFCVQPRISNER